MHRYRSAACRPDRALLDYFFLPQKKIIILSPHRPSRPGEELVHSYRSAACPPERALLDHFFLPMQELNPKPWPTGQAGRGAGAQLQRRGVAARPRAAGLLPPPARAAAAAVRGGPARRRALGQRAARRRRACAWVRPLHPVHWASSYCGHLSMCKRPKLARNSPSALRPLGEPAVARHLSVHNSEHDCKPVRMQSLKPCCCGTWSTDHL